MFMEQKQRNINDMFQEITSTAPQQLVELANEPITRALSIMCSNDYITGEKKMFVYHIEQEKSPLKHVLNPVWEMYAMVYDEYTQLLYHIKQIFKSHVKILIMANTDLEFTKHLQLFNKLINQIPDTNLAEVMSQLNGALCNLEGWIISELQQVNEAHNSTMKIAELLQKEASDVVQQEADQTVAANLLQDEINEALQTIDRLGNSENSNDTIVQSKIEYTFNQLQNLLNMQAQHTSSSSAPTIIPEEAHILSQTMIHTGNASHKLVIQSCKILHHITLVLSATSACLNNIVNLRKSVTLVLNQPNISKQRAFASLRPLVHVCIECTVHKNLSGFSSLEPQVIQQFINICAGTPSTNTYSL